MSLTPGPILMIAGAEQLPRRASQIRVRREHSSLHLHAYLDLVHIHIGVDV
jgi:hypothetical protein